MTQETIAILVFALPVALLAVSMPWLWLALDKQNLASRPLHMDTSLSDQYERLAQEARDNEAKRQASFDANMTDLHKALDEAHAIRTEALAQLAHVQKIQAEYERLIHEIPDDYRAAKAAFDEHHAQIKADIKAQSQKIGKG